MTERVDFVEIEPWTRTIRAAIDQIAADMAPLDRREIFGLRPTWHESNQVVEDLARLVGMRVVLEGFVAFRHMRRDQTSVPVAVAVAFRSSLPMVAEIAMFGRAGHGRAAPAIYAEIARRQKGFAARHNCLVAQVPILTRHRAARRMAARLGAQAAWDYGAVGTNGESYTQHIWRLSDGISDAETAGSGEDRPLARSGVG